MPSSVQSYFGLWPNTCKTKLCAISPGTPPPNTAKNGSIFIELYVCALYLISGASLDSSPGQPRYNQCIPVKDLMRHVLFQSLLLLSTFFIAAVSVCSHSLLCVCVCVWEPGIPAEGSPDEEAQWKETFSQFLTWKMKPNTPTELYQSSVLTGGALSNSAVNRDTLTA